MVGYTDMAQCKALAVLAVKRLMMWSLMLCELRLTPWRHVTPLAVDIKTWTTTSGLVGMGLLAAPNTYTRCVQLQW